MVHHAPHLCGLAQRLCQRTRLQLMNVVTDLVGQVPRTTRFTQRKEPLMEQSVSTRGCTCGQRFTQQLDGLVPVTKLLKQVKQEQAFVERRAVLPLKLFQPVKYGNRFVLLTV
jgi:hypothetical protein